MKKEGFLPEDLYKIRYLREVTISPDGKRYAYRVEYMDKKENKYFSDLYVTDISGKPRLYMKRKRFSNIKWSPDNRFIYFILTKDKISGIWAIPVDGGEAFSVSKEKGIYGDFDISPDGKLIAVEYFLPEEMKKEKKDKKKGPPVYRDIDSVWYKLDGKGFLPREKPHIHILNVKTGKLKKITNGINGDHSPKFSPDGKYVTFSSNRNKDIVDRFFYIDIFIVDTLGKKEKKLKTPDGPKGNPVFSPDGKKIAYLGRLHPDDMGGWRNEYLWLAPINGEGAVNLSKKFDRSCENLIIDDSGNSANMSISFSKNGKYIYFPASDKGNSYIYSINIKNKKITPLMQGNFNVYSYDTDGNGNFVFAASNPIDPGNIYLINKKNNFKKVSDINQKFFVNKIVVEPEEFNFKGAEGDEIQGWIIKPVGFKKGKKYPLLYEIHGGPHMLYGNSFFHEFQFLANKGYVVFYSNPHGSQGYGEKFAKALHNHWGEPDLEDLNAAVKKLKKLDYVDEKRMGVLGGSYGGFMTNWVVGHTNVFKVAVTQRSISNVISFLTTDFGWLWPKEFKGNWWEKGNFKFYWNMSPLKYVENIKTPLLIIHSENDYRCPINQGEELYVALKLLKRKVKMVVFPEEPHGLSRHGRPDRRIKRLEFIHSFIDEHIGEKKTKR